MKKLAKKFENIMSKARLKWTLIYSSIGAVVWSFFCYQPAWAEYNPFDDVKGVIQNALFVGGGFLVVVGAVQVGIQLKDGNQGGAQLHGAIFSIIGGVVIILAAAFVSRLSF